MDRLAVEIIFSALVTFRLAYMIVAEEGPFEIFDRMRNLVYAKLPGWVDRGINCFYCVSFWVSFIPAMLLFRYPFGLLVAPAIATLAILVFQLHELIKEVTEKNKRGNKY